MGLERSKKKKMGKVMMKEIVLGQSGIFFSFLIFFSHISRLCICFFLLVLVPKVKKKNNGGWRGHL